jgi:hypothetical protein
MRSHKPLGQLLVDAKLVTPEQLEGALAAQGRSPERLGQILVEQKIITEAQLTKALSQQLSIPWVALDRVTFSPELVRRVPKEFALHHGVVPVYMRRSRDGARVLFIAMQDPTQLQVTEALASLVQMQVKPMVAARTDLGAALYRLYGESASREREERATAQIKRQPLPPMGPPVGPPPAPPVVTNANRSKPAPTHASATPSSTPNATASALPSPPASPTGSNSTPADHDQAIDSADNTAIDKTITLLDGSTIRIRGRK